MNIQEYIDSGILELYVYGALTSQESEEVSKVLMQYPEVETEVSEIESALQSLATAAAPYNPEEMIAAIKAKLRNHNGVIQLQPTAANKRTKLISFISVAASLIFLVGIFVLLNRTNNLRQELRVAEAQKAIMETKMQDAENSLQQTKTILAVVRDPKVTKVPLAGQQVAPDAYVNVFWDKAQNKAYIDAMGLPEPPEGMVYQVWSLKLDPLTPTSMGLLDDFNANENKVFTFDNPNESQAFGITLEPAGGSESPTMDQLYTLGVVTTNA
ncbi:anti-sigma factor domain-containing protein [Leeuwenhoekiella sp. NPDC079379]|uniref:anti-sigma factor n=1 Tax=Leeuwenhoekiella sp. NPDC079379 TaxID=3364122 RepID=UPI0037C91C1D